MWRSPECDVVRCVNVPIAPCPDFTSVLLDADPLEVRLVPAVDEKTGNGLALRGVEPQRVGEFEDHRISS